MAAFARVELHEKSPTDKPTREIYEKLHSAMSDAKFYRRFIKAMQATPPVFVSLPTGMYVTYLTESAEALAAKAKKVAEAVWPKVSVLVVKAERDEDIASANL